MADSLEWIEKLSELRRLRTPCAVVVVTGVRGSGPRDAGARMVVANGRLAWGTIGGGNLERLAIEHATEMIGRGERASESVAYPLSEKAGQCCGGEVTLFFETYPWSRRRVTVFGAGHVGQALGGLAPWLRADVVLVDGRSAEELEPPLPAERPYEVTFIDAPEAEVDALPEGSLVVVMTHSHALDLEVVMRALKHGKLGYIGLIGSERKWARFRARLEERGFSREQIARVHCPIGVGARGVATSSKEPTAIALATAAELLEVMEGLPAPGAGAPQR